jgi:hypothetical protein
MHLFDTLIGNIERKYIKNILIFPPRKFSFDNFYCLTVNQVMDVPY